jgi:hypothetical protein
MTHRKRNRATVCGKIGPWDLLIAKGLTMEEEMRDIGMLAIGFVLGFFVTAYIAGRVIRNYRDIVAHMEQWQAKSHASVQKLRDTRDEVIRNHVEAERKACSKIAYAASDRIQSWDMKSIADHIGTAIIERKEWPWEV